MFLTQTRQSILRYLVSSPDKSAVQTPSRETDLYKKTFAAESHWNSASRNDEILASEQVPSTVRKLIVLDSEELLARQGYRVRCAESGHEGMLQLSRRYFDVVICDLRMPDMNGFDFIQAARAFPLIPRSSSLPIIILTACSSDLEFSALEAGADMFCEKKCVDKLLVSQIEFLLS